MSILTEMERIGTALDAVEDGKAAIAEAITSKGVPTEEGASFDTMAINIGLIEGGGVPEQGYTMLDWISSDGESYIVTDINVRSSYGFNCEFSYVVVPSATDVWTSPFGCRSTSSTSRFDLVIGNKYGAYFGYGNRAYNTKIVSGDYALYMRSSGYVYVSKSIYYGTFNSTEAFTPNCPLAILATNTNGTTSSLYTQPFMSLTLFGEDNQIIHELKPAKRNSDGEVGILDRKTGSFYANSGLGSILHS